MHPIIQFFLLLCLLFSLPQAVEANAAFIIPTAMSLSKASLTFDFRRIPYAAGIHRIHQPPPLFTIEHVDPPSMTPNKTAILFTCSTACLRGARVRMFTSRPDESNLFFFKDNRAMYGVRLSVAPTRAFESHRMQVDVTFFENGGALRNLVPMVMLVESLQAFKLDDTDRLDPFFTQYRRAVLRGKGSSDFWIMAERVIREYSA